MDFKKTIKIFISFILYLIMIIIAVIFSKYIYYEPYKTSGEYSIFSPIIYAVKLINIISVIYIFFYLWEILLKKDLFYYNKFILIICVFLFCVNYFIFKIL